MRYVEHRLINPSPMMGDRVAQARREVIDFFGQPEEVLRARRAPVDEKLYLNGEVRDALMSLFYGKCAYCETDKGSSVNVEHHRPIANAGGGRNPLPHHYAWLAYEWENLLLACQTCASLKRNLFPLNGGRAELLAPLGRTRAQERPKLLDPGYDQPHRHLDFTVDGVVHGRSRRGADTIRLLELNRTALVEERRQAFHNFRRDIATSLRDRVRIAETLRRMGEDNAPFAGSKLILRYRFLAALGRMVSHYEFQFDDAEALIESVLQEADPVQIMEALQVLDVGPFATARPTSGSLPRPATPRIRRIEISNFKGIDSVVIDVPEARSDSRTAPCLMLLGENATGKSTILEAVALALMGTKRAGTLGLRAGEYRPNRKFGGRPGMHGPTEVAVEFYGAPPAELRIEGNAFVGTSDERANVLAYGSRRYFKRRARRTRIGGVKGLFDPSWLLPHPDEWVDTLNEDQFPMIAKSLHGILLLANRAYLKKEVGGPVVIADGDIETPIARHSEGYRSIFGTTVDMLRGLMGGTDLLDAEGVVLVDEIETHLHPRWKLRLMTALRRALPRVQFIVTTHDPLCLRGMGRGEVQVMRRDADSRLGLAQDLPDVSGMRIDQILTSEHFGMQSTLDPEFQDTFDRYYLLLRESQTNPEKMPEVARLRDQINRRQRLGVTEREQRMLEAIDRNIATRVADAAKRKVQDDALEAELDAIWTEARSGTA